MDPMPRPDASAKIAAAAPKNSNRTRLAILITAAIVAAIGVAVGVAINGSRPSTTSPTGTASGAVTGLPKGAVALGGPMLLTRGAAGAAVLDIYEDPQCPVCKVFEQTYGQAVAQLVAQNKATVRVHTLTFLDTNLKNDSSTRAGNGAMCAADQGKFAAYTAAVYSGQPTQEGVGWTDAQLESFATQAAVPDLAAWRTCQRAMTYRGHLQSIQVNATKNGVNGTPTVRVNGKDLKLTGDPQELLAAVGGAQ
jgi:protein-disulfide isomerase